MAGGLFGGGDGTAASPFIIEDVLDLDAVRNGLSKYYQLNNSIDLNVEPFNVESGWVPIDSFTGVFDGQGYVIKNLFINRPSEIGIGLFGRARHPAVIENVVLKNVDIKGNQSVGSVAGVIAGSNASSGIFRCGSTGKVAGSGYYCGGIVGTLQGNGTMVENCYSQCTVTGGSKTGGIVGEAYGSSGYVTINKCLFFGALPGSSSYPITGYDYRATVSNSYYLNSLGKTGLGTVIDLQTMKNLESVYPGFNTYHKSRTLWRFDRENYPFFNYELIPYGQEPAALFKANGSYHTKETEWIDLGTDIDAMSVFEVGIPLKDVMGTEWWKHFEGEVEILLASKTENPAIDVIAIASEVVFDAEEQEAELEIDSWSPDTMETEGNKYIYVGIENLRDLQETDIDISIESVIPEELMLDVQTLLIEATNQDDLSLDTGTIEVEIESNETESMTLEGEQTISLEGLNTEDGEINGGSLLVESLEDDELGLKQELNITGEATSQLRSLLSIDNGRNWWTFDTTADNWVQANMADIDIIGMTNDLLNSLDYFDYEKLVPNKIYLKDLTVATQVSSTLDDMDTIFWSLEVEYYENQPAFVLDAQLTPDTIHNQYSELRFRVLDLEGDTVKYKILVKKAGELDYKQVDPSPDEREWHTRPAEGSVFHAYNYPYFNTGLNKIKVIVQDSRGASSENEFDLYLLNTAPFVQMTHDRLGMNLVVGDEDIDSVSYRVLLNDETLFGYTDFQRSPVNLRYLWRPGQLKRDEPNTVRVEVMDSFGTKTVEEFQIDSQFTNIMFMDSTGEYLSDNLGQLLSYLDFGPIVGGTITAPKTVKVVNQTGSAIKNLEVKVKSGQIAPGVDVEVSEGLMPFSESDNVQFEGVVPYQGHREFYVRVKSEKETRGIRGFEAIASADTEI